MIVSSEDFAVHPIADRLIERAAGHLENEIERDGFAWSNELARHVIELKTNGPVASLAGLAAGFQAEVAHAGALLAEEGARLLPGGMHPTMDPRREFSVWPHGDRVIYETFDRIFDCTGHGWANLQSAHLNLPFADDAEFGRLHAAMRALMPLVPALAAASPYLEGREAGALDERLRQYARNARRVPSVSGFVVPEPVFDRRGYEAMLEGIYRDLAPHDPEGVLRHEWVNARGCIARFDRMAIELRLLDTQECPRADVAIAAAVTAVLRLLCDPDPRHQARLRGLETEALVRTLWRCAESGDEAIVDDVELLRALGLAPAPARAGEVWARLVERAVAPASSFAEHMPALRHILDHGCLARRMRRHVGGAPDPDSLRALCAELADCLEAGRQLGAAPLSPS
jgi:gamma-glutamyl:cysteine ligase YbdK (ATP-grasp superfamily)